MKPTQPQLKEYSEEKSMIRAYMFLGLAFSVLVGLSVQKAVSALAGSAATNPAIWGIAIGASLFTALVVVGFSVVAEVIQKRTGDK